MMFMREEKMNLNWLSKNLHQELVKKSKKRLYSTFITNKISFASKQKVIIPQIILLE